MSIHGIEYTSTAQFRAERQRLDDALCAFIRAVRFGVLSRDALVLAIDEAEAATRALVMAIDGEGRGGAA